MLPTLLIPPDYWAFLAGLNGFLLFLVCLALTEHQHTRQFFTWLGFFAVFQWLQQWLSMFRPVMGPAMPWTEASTFLLTLAMAALGIAGVVTLPRHWLRFPLLGLILLMTAIGLATGLRGQFSAFGPILLSLGLISSLLADTGLALVARQRRSAALHLAALALTGYGLAVLLASPPELLGLAGDLATGTIWTHLQAHILALQVCFGLLSTALLWWYSQREWWDQQPSASATARTGQALVFLAALGILLALGGISVGLFDRSLDRDMRENLAQRARLLGSALPLQTIRLLTGTADDEGTPPYVNLKQLLGRIRVANRDCRFIYILRFRDGQPVFLVDSEPDDSTEVSPPGQVFGEASATLKAMAQCPQAFVEGPVTDRWGTWISAFEVLRDPRDGVFLGLLGLDIDVRDWQRQIALHKMLPMGIILLMAMLWTGFYFFQKKLLLASFQVAQSEERYRSLVEGSPNGIGLFDPAGRCQAMNRKGLEMLGAPASQVLDRPFVEQLPPQQQSRVQEAFDQVRAGQAVGLEVEIGTEDGHRRFWQVVFNPLQSETGDFQGSVGILADITPQKQAEQALRTSRALLQSLLEAIPDLLVVIDRHYRIIYSNNQGQCFLGITPGSAYPTCYQTFHNRQTPCPDCPVQQVFRTGQILEREVSNELFTEIYEIRAFPVFDGTGQVNMVIEYIRDITARKEVEKALQTREAKLQSIFRAAPVGIGLVENRVFKEVNERVCQLTGYTQEELVGQNARILYPSQEEFEFVGREKYRQIAQKGLGTVETRWRHKDGQIIEVLLSSAPLFPGTDATETLFTVMDITEQKKLEALRANLGKMESLGIMAGGIAHDFNNILMAILGNISLLSMATKPAEIREGLQEAEQACRQAMLLAKQLLTFAKGGAPVKKACDLRVLVEESARLALSGSKVKVDYTWPADLWSVNVDAGQMHQVFTNLLINADQAMPAGGQIAITAANHRLDAGSPLPLPPGNYVRCQISDQGVGIAPEHLDKIFDPYFTTKQKGSGLGLTMVYSIIKQHGGFVTVDSRLGQGTTFTVYLPVVEPGSLQITGNNDGLFLGHGRVLVLEDEPAVRTIMAKMLAKLGYEPVFAVEGQEVLNLYAAARQEHQDFAAVILDLTIPGGMGGLEAGQMLREEDPGVKTIVSSGYADDPVLANYRSYGFAGALAKPYRLIDLSQVLHQILS